MKNKDLSPLDELFNDKLSGFSVPPPPSAWSGVLDSLQQQQDEAARTLLANHEVAPPADAWEKIRRRLPLMPILRHYLNALSGIAAILLLFLLGYTFFNKYTEGGAPSNVGSGNQTSQVTKPAANAPQGGVKQSDGFVSQLDEENGQNLTFQYNNQRQGASPTGGQGAAAQGRFGNNRNGNNRGGAHLVVPPVNLGPGNQAAQNAAAAGGLGESGMATPVGLEANAAQAGTEVGQSEEKSVSWTLFDLLSYLAVTSDKVIQNELWMAPSIPSADQMSIHPGNPAEGNKVQKLYAEVFGQAQSNWVLNSAMRSEILSGGGQYAFTPGYAFGAAFGYRINKSLSLQMEVLAESNQGQRFTGTGGQSALIRQHFMYFPLLLQWQPLANRTSSKAHWGYLVGLQYGFQRSASMPADPNQLSNHLVKNELGLVLGTECTWNITDNLGLLVGARLNVGSDLTRLNRLFANDNSINAALGLRLGLLWQFGEVMP